MMRKRKKRIHFIGIGGIGMSGIAQVLLDMGYRVSGSDLAANSLTRKIEDAGGRIWKNHAAAHVSADVDIVVYSSSIDKDNPEIRRARELKIPVIHRAAALAEIMNNGKAIAVTGTHGKTTTTSLIAVMLEKSGFDPTVIIGGEVDLFGGNAKLGMGGHIVAEADESDGSFLLFKPLYSVITNIEMEHVDHYRSLDDAIRSYAAFARNCRAEGSVFYNRDDPCSRKMMKGFTRKAETFGFSKKSDLYAVRIRMDKFASFFGCVYRGKDLGRMSLAIPGRHNVLNGLAAALVGLNMGIGFERIVRAVKDFRGTKRRFHLRSDRGGVMLIDDYAHHPTEIRAVLDTCRNWKAKRIVAIFQPHRYTRTLYLAEEFGKCFAPAHKLILTDIYAASERPIAGVSVKNIYDRVKKTGKAGVMIMKKEEIASYIMSSKKRGDMIVVMGAGDIKDVADELAERLG